MAERVIKIGFEKKREILRATIPEQDVLDNADQKGLTFMQSLCDIIGSSRIRYVCWRRA